MAKKSENTPLHQRLVLNRYILWLFGKRSFEELAQHDMKRLSSEGVNEDGVSNFCNQIALTYDASLSYEELRGYDRNILRHTAAIQGKRATPVKWKYFQYLALLFAEIYLDRYMNDRERLLYDLKTFCRGPHGFSHVKFNAEDLHKIAFWSATGSGKTLIMHINIKQYQHYLTQSGRDSELNRILLITPNEGLSKQHKREFDLSGMRADFFSKQGGGLFAGSQIEIIEITKFDDKDGDKKVDVEAFEDRNLVLVDEGHRGSSGKEWMKYRKKLAARGFAFEYSATLGQAISGKEKLEKEYAKAILFDYSYRYFYEDGFGKDYQIFNLPNNEEGDNRTLYLTTCLLSFYQQKLLYKKCDTKNFNIENPLWVFVGSSVNAVRKQQKKPVSDVVDILLFLAEFISPENKSNVLGNIKTIIDGNTPLLDSEEQNIFENILPHLNRQENTEIYDAVLKEVFNTEQAGGFHLETIKDAEGEIALTVGANNAPFGIINVGDSSSLCRLCDAHDALTVNQEKNFTGSLFHRINQPNSSINILIGAKKFTEGWNSWRVSTMGLLNVGSSEGPKIIQLFGRGVRLKGYENTLKRHKHLTELGVEHRSDLAQLECLNIFGIRANYMETFKD